MTLSNQRIDINLGWAGGRGCDGRECSRIAELLRSVDLSGFPVMFEIETLCSSHFFAAPPGVVAVVYFRMLARDREVRGKITRVETSASIEAGLTDLAILELAKGKLLELVTHELLEQFIVKGDRVFDPHAEDERRRQRARHDEALLAAAQRAREDEALRMAAQQEFTQLPPETTRPPKPPSYYEFSFDKRTLIRQQKPRR